MILSRAQIGVTSSVVALAPGVYALVFLAPEQHGAQGSVEVSIDAASLFARASDFESSASWRQGVDVVRRLEDRDGHPVYEEKSNRGVLRYELVELVPVSAGAGTGGRIVTEIVESED